MTILRPEIRTKMNKYLPYTALCLLMVCSQAADAFEFTKPKSRKELASENAALRASLDSLQQCPPKRDTVYITQYVEKKRSWQDLIGQSVTESEPLQVHETGSELWATDYAPGKTPDSVYVRRLEALDSPVMLPYNSTVRSCIVTYSERNSAAMGRILGLCDYYMPMFEEVFDRYSIPLELTALAIVESRLNPTATSKAGAKGLWQFMYASAKGYGLEISSYIDERLDVVKSTEAAARYLRDAYASFGDWSLAISAYNCGYGNVRKAIKRAGGKTDYWSIYPYLPRETRSYLPAMVGILYTLRYHRELGIEPVPCELPLRRDTVHVKGKMHLAQVSETIGTELGMLRKLNPQYKHDVIPSGSKEYLLILPMDDALAFVGQQDSISLHKADKYLSTSVIRSIENAGTGNTIIYKVKSGDNLSRIAAKHGVSVASLRKWNNIQGSLIKPGQRLYIYK